MKIAARRRLALGVLATSSALVAGVLIAPSSIAAPGGLTIAPSGAVNTDANETIVFNTTEADLRFGGTAVFTRIDEPATFTVRIPGPTPPLGADRSQPATINFTDVGNGVPGDGPADAGTYSVSVTGAPPPLPGLSGGGGNDTCTSCFTVLPGGEVSIESVSPSSVRPGTAQNVSILGAGFERSVKVEMLLPGTTTVDSGVNANNAPTRDNTNTGTAQEDGITTRTELRRRVVVAVGTEPGARDVRVTNLDIVNGTGRSAVCSRCFFVAGAALTSTVPTTAFNDPTQPLTRITFNGSEVTDGTPRLDFVGDPGSASRSQLTIVGTNATRSSDGTSITADFDLRNAAPGDNAYQPIVESESGVVNACDTCRFTVIQREQRKPPTLTSLDRSRSVPGTQNTIRQDETATFVATGTNFSRGVTLLFPGTTGTGLTITGVEFFTPERIEVTIAAASNASPGDRDPQARLTDNQSDSTSAPCDNCLVVAQGTGASPSPSASASPAPGNESFAFERFAGQDRYTTAARIATGSFSSAETVLLANGQSDDPRTSRNEDHFPDALAGAYLAGERKAPTLLTTENTTPQATRDALRALATRNIVLLGGPSAISDSQESNLRSSGFTVTRIGGQNRYDTAKQIATTPEMTYVGDDENGDRTAVVASGEGFADALVAGPLGYAAQFPLLITAKDGLSQPTREALQSLNIEQVIIPGGLAAVSQKTQDEIEALGITTRRFAGSSRTETAALVADYAYNSLAFDRAHVDLARGDRFPDALAGGPHAGVRRAPIVLTATPNSISAATEEFLRRRGSSLMSGDIFGGTSAVSQSAEDEAERAVREGTAGGGEPSPSPSGSADPSASPDPSASADPSVSPDPSAAPDPSASPSASADPSVSPSP